jgi:putative endonuclease
MPCAVYILCNKPCGTLYCGTTSNLVKRIYEHKAHIYSDSFSAKYQTTILVWYQTTDDMISAITREKQIKAGSRKKKIELIEYLNPTWKDLYNEIL